MHHFTTSLSTIEISSLNAARLVKEFRKFFSDAITNGVDEYKTYVVKNNANDIERINALKELLDKNGIQSDAAIVSSRGMQDGYSYQTGKNQMFSIDAGDVLVQTQQSRGALAKVLFEPKSHLVDSATYDITAWSAPYAYGLNTYASKNKIAMGAASEKPKVNNTETSYGYVLTWKGIQTVTTVSQVLQKGILLRYAAE